MLFTQKNRQFIPREHLLHNRRTGRKIPCGHNKIPPSRAGLPDGLPDERRGVCAFGIDVPRGVQSHTAPVALHRYHTGLKRMPLQHRQIVRPFHAAHAEITQFDGLSRPSCRRTQARRRRGSLRKPIRLLQIAGQHDRQFHAALHQPDQDVQLLPVKVVKSVQIDLRIVKQRALRQTFEHPRQLLARVRDLVGGDRPVYRKNLSEIAQFVAQSSLRLSRGAQQILRRDSGTGQLIENAQQILENLRTPVRTGIHRQDIARPLYRFIQHHEPSRRRQALIR